MYKHKALQSLKSWMEMLKNVEEEREEISYIDVTSEYPYVNKYGTYPVGHPDIYLKAEN